ncbi:MAG: tetratricopeptide repeat protein [Phycisphaerales bacterium]|nr:tetratricopeptide repeat protein [Phycisphaerales bacterium]
MNMHESRRAAWMLAGVVGMASGAIGQATGSGGGATPPPVPAPALAQPTSFRPAPSSPIQGVPAQMPSIRSFGGDGSWRTRLKTPPPRTGDVFVPRPIIRPVGDNTQSSLVRPTRDVVINDGVQINQNGIGTTISGGVITDDFRDGFRLGVRAGYRYGRHQSPYWYYTNGWYWPGYWTSYQTIGPERVYTPDPRLLASSGQPVQQPQRELTLVERAEWSLYTGDADRAVDRLEAHLAAEPDDAGAKRLLGVALLEQRKTEQAVAVVMQAYLDQPMLARTPIETEILAGGEMTHRARFTKVMAMANRTKTASAYFVACVLAQSEGRLDIAKKLLKKAEEAGLAKSVLDEMRLAIAKG